MTLVAIVIQDGDDEEVNIEIRAEPAIPGGGGGDDPVHLAALRMVSAAAKPYGDDVEVKQNQ